MSNGFVLPAMGLSTERRNPVDELRKLVEKLQSDSERLRRTSYTIAADLISGYADELSALLAQHAVAEPPQQVWPNTQANAYPYGWRWMRLRGYLKEWLTPHQYDLAKGYLETALSATPFIAAHTAEQPKLTPSVWTITEEAAKHSHFCYHKDSDEWKCSCGEVLSKYVMPYDERRKLNSLDREMAFVRFNHKDHFRFVLHGLLTSPVAPPPRPLVPLDGGNWYYDAQRDIVMIDGRKYEPAVEEFRIPSVMAAIPPPVALPPPPQPWTQRELEVLSGLAKKLDVSEFVVLRQGLRIYQLIVEGTHHLEGPHGLEPPVAPGEQPPRTPMTESELGLSGVAAPKADAKDGADTGSCRQQSVDSPVPPVAPGEQPPALAAQPSPQTKEE